ncbi:MAG: penicillin-insensitive murein endopeptidase [Methylococcaceae bacterium]|jgi:RHS repeat-associated protein
MSNSSGSSPQVISLPKGGGALSGIGETFSPDLHTGTGNFTVPLALPSGRGGFQPQISLVYSTGHGNGPFGLGWDLSIPGVSRKTSQGVPRYDDARDTFLLSGAEDLVPISTQVSITQFRPRTEGLFARILRHHDADNDFWEVRSKDGLRSIYGTPSASGSDPAVIANPSAPNRIFAWNLSRTVDLFGNHIEYEYERDAGEDGPRHWDQLYLHRIRYANYTDTQGENQFLVTVLFEYSEPDVRPDPFSEHRSGFEIRTRRRCERIVISTHANQERLVRSYEFDYLDERVAAGDLPETVLPHNRVSLLSCVCVIGHDGDQMESLPPLEFSYSRFTPERRDFFPLQGRDLPAQALSNPAMELVDLFGNGLPDLIEMNGTVRYWRNLGGGRFDLPRMMNEAPAGLSFADPGVQLIDANGDGRADLLVNKPGLSGYYPLLFDGHWDRRSFQRYRVAPSFDLEGEDVALVDLDGDGVTDAIRSGTRFECYFNDPHEGWGETRRVERRPLAEFPDVNFADRRVRWGDMSGDGMQDMVLVYDGNIEYWPNLGYGNWGPRIHMRNSPRFPAGYDPRQILIGDVDGDGLADLIFVDHCSILLWINQSGNGWSDPIEISGTPGFTNQDDVRLVDLLGTGVAGILWSQGAFGSRRERFFFHDFTGGMKPYVLNEMNNHRGAITQVTYRSSTEEYLRDQAHRETRWRTTLPFPVQVVSQVVAIDEFSRGRLTTEYRYHHGYWDGGDHEFRGFGCVEMLTTETFDTYQALTENANAFTRVEQVHYSPPTLTRTWFHLGPVGDEFGDWQAVDHRDEYWNGDAPYFSEERGQLQDFLTSLEQRRNRRDALRTLRGSVLRTELYALDDNPRSDRPYTVTESVYGLREIDPPGDATGERRRIFFPHARAQRTTQWERGDDPLTQIGYTDDYDEYGQPRRQLQVACPRGWRNFESDTRPGTDYLTTYAETRFAQRDDDLYMVDRAATANSFQIFPPQDQQAHEVTVSQLRNQAFDGTAPQELIGQSFNYYDGEAFIGLPLGELGQFGALVRTETLVITETILAEAYRSNDPDAPPIPPYLEPGGAVNWPDEYPEPFRQRMPPLAGYRFHTGDADHARGYFIETVRNRYDFQMPDIPNPRGLLLTTRDPLDRETTIDYDNFDLLPELVTDPAGLTTIAHNDYRVLQPDLVTDPNGNRTAVTFTPLGLPATIAVMGKENEEPPVGDTQETPGTRFEYDLLAYDSSPPVNRQPVLVRSIRRVHHVNDFHIPAEEREETIESIEYSDGFGRLLQTRAQAEDMLFGGEVFGNDTLTADQSDTAVTREPVTGRRRNPDGPLNVVVSGWQIYDNKGQVVEKYEPFFDTGWDYLSLEEAETQRTDGNRNLFGQRVMQFYDPRGQVIRTVNPDGSEQRVIFGVPPDLTEPDTFDPTPWEAYTYDANDLAPLSQGQDETGDPIALTNRAPDDHHFTPASIEIDALGRTIHSVQRNSAGQQNEIVTRSSYDIRGNLLTVTDALDRLAFSYTYDLANRALRVESIDAGIKRTVLDVLGNAIELRDSKGALVLTAFDVLNRPQDVWARDDSDHHVSQRQHLVYGDNAVEIGFDRTAARERNALGQLVMHYDEAGRMRAATYDFKGNLLEKTRQVISDQEILSIFDGAEANEWRISAYQVDWQPGGASFEARAAAILDPTEYTTSTRYDGLNRVREVEYPRDVDNERKLLRPIYNRAGALESVNFDRDVYVQRIAYNAKGQRTLIAYGNGVMTRYAYDPQTFRLSRLRSERYLQPDDITYQPSGLPLQDFGYDYDLAGNITTIRDRTPESGILNNPDALLVADPILAQLLVSGNALDRRFDYDPIYRLLSATGRECDMRPAIPPWFDEPRCTDLTRTRTYTEHYRYDVMGNMLELRHDNGFGGFTRSFTHRAENNRLDILTIGQSNFDYVFDDAGNMTQETTSRHFEWDYGNRMKVFRTQTEGAEPSVYAHYLYDASGMRVKKLVRRQSGQFGVTTYIDGAFEHHRRVTGGSTTENNTLHVMDNQQRIALSRVGQAFADDASPAVQFQLGDHLGNSNEIVDDNAALINREEFTPYGETSFGSFARKRYRFTGKERDEESGFYYFGCRYFVSWLSNWTSPDPVGHFGGLNLYTYAKSNPLRFVDPLGLMNEPAVHALDSNMPPHNQHEEVPNDGNVNGHTSATFDQPMADEKPRGQAANDSQEFDVDTVEKTYPEEIHGGYVQLEGRIGLKPRRGRSRHEPHDRRERQWGHPSVIKAIYWVATEFNATHPDRPVVISDISKKGGGRLDPHKSHKKGLDVDILLVPRKSTMKNVTVKTLDKYDQQVTKELIELFLNNPYITVQIIWLADPDIEAYFEEQRGIKIVHSDLGKKDAHMDHFHIRFVDYSEPLRIGVGGKRQPRVNPQVEDSSRYYYGPIGIESSGRLHYPRTYLGPTAIVYSP